MSKRELHRVIKQALQGYVAAEARAMLMAVSSVLKALDYARRRRLVSDNEYSEIIELVEKWKAGRMQDGAQAAVDELGRILGVGDPAPDPQVLQAEIERLIKSAGCGLPLG